MGMKYPKWINGLISGKIENRKHDFCPIDIYIYMPVSTVNVPFNPFWDEVLRFRQLYGSSFAAKIIAYSMGNCPLRHVETEEFLENHHTVLVSG